MFKNEVGDIIGIIFVNTTCQSLPFKPNKANIDINHNMRRQVSKETFKNYYRVPEKNIKTITDPTKEQVKDAFKDLAKRAREFTQ